MNFPISTPFEVDVSVHPKTCAAAPDNYRFAMPPLRSVLTYGGFDGFHSGHAHWLGQLSGLGSDLIVGCATDEFCAQMGRPTSFDFSTRRAVLDSCRFVSRVIALNNWDQRLSDIVNYNISVLAVQSGADQPLEHLDDIVQVVHLPSELPLSWVGAHTISA